MFVLFGGVDSPFVLLVLSLQIRLKETSPTDPAATGPLVVVLFWQNGDGECPARFLLGCSHRVLSFLR